MRQYETVSGDTFDVVAHKIWGDARRAGELMQANFAALEYMIFPAGVILQVPEDGEMSAASNQTSGDADEAFNFREVILGTGKTGAGKDSV